MSDKPDVFKFGGKALKDADGFRHVRSVIEAHRSAPLIIVVSAVASVTDQLERVVDLHARQDEGTQAVLDAIKQLHYQLAVDLVGEEAELLSTLNDLFVEIDWILEEPPHESYDFMYDQIVSVGELLSSRLLEALLRTDGWETAWLDARDVLRTDNLYRESWVDWNTTRQQMGDKIPPLLAEGKVVVSQGFIGSTSENFTTTLGRTGSDFSAAVFAHCLEARALTIWKDVPGMLTADPKFYRDALKLEALSYEEAVEMTYYGAHVIHLKTVKPLQSKGIPLHVRSYLHPEEKGTLISGEVEVNYPPMVAVERQQVLLRLATRDFSFVAEHHVRDIFIAICDLRLQVNLTQNTGMYFMMCLTYTQDRVEQLLNRLADQFEVQLERPLEIITVRHPQQELLDDLHRNREVLFEKRIPHTVQLIVRA